MSVSIKPKEKYKYEINKQITQAKPNLRDRLSIWLANKKKKKIFCEREVVEHKIHSKPTLITSKVDVALRHFKVGERDLFMDSINLMRNLLDSFACRLRNNPKCLIYFIAME